MQGDLEQNMNDVVSYVTDGRIGVITVNNPPVNALSQAVRQGLLDAIRAAGADDTDAVLLRCTGRTFIAGADIKEFGKPHTEPFLPDLLNEIEACDKIVVAALHGTALGGGGDMTTMHAVNFFETIRGNQTLTSPIEQGVVSQLLTHYANIAERIGKGFDVDETTGRIFDREAMKLWRREYEPGWEPKL